MIKLKLEKAEVQTMDATLTRSTPAAWILFKVLFWLCIQTGFILLTSCFFFTNVSYGSHSQNPSEDSRLDPCKYVEESRQISTSVPTPQIFTNVQRVILLIAVSGPEKALTEHKGPQTRDLRRLALCLLKRKLGAQKSISLFQANTWQDLRQFLKEKKVGDLFISVTETLHTDLAGTTFFKPLLGFQVTYFRPDVNDFESSRKNCFYPLEIQDDPDKMLKLVTKVFVGCLPQRISSGN